MPQMLERNMEAGVARLRINRPELHNAFDAALIAELTVALEVVGTDPTVRVVVLEGAGTSFSAGADLHWMRSMAAATETGCEPVRSSRPPKRLSCAHAPTPDRRCACVADHFVQRRADGLAAA